MKAFLLKISVMSFLFLLFVTLVFWQADGKSDAYYLRFATPDQNALIIGNSRSAQGLLPEELNVVLNERNSPYKFFNYSFTKANSPYGEIYLNSIKNKLADNTTNSVFILTVDPWSIGAKSEDPNDMDNWRENGLFLDGLHFVSMKPNFEYLLNYYQSPYYTLLYNEQEKMILHDDGWLEITITMDSSSVSKRTQKKISQYSDLLNDYKFSNLRLEYLEKTIDFLKTKGTVYLVRMPIDEPLFEIEEKLMPDFNGLMNGLAKEKFVEYFDLSSMNKYLEFTDGNHLYKKSGIKVSKKLAQLILQSEKSKL